MKIEVARLNPYTSDSLRAFVTLSVTIDNVTIEIRDCKYHVKPEGDWIQLPSRQYEDRESGEKRYTNTVHFPDRDEYMAFQDQAKAAVRAAINPDPYQSEHDSIMEEFHAKAEAPREVAPSPPAPRPAGRPADSFDDIPF